METNKVLIFGGIFLLALTIAILLTGGVRKDVSIRNYKSSIDNKNITIRVKTNSNIRYVRKAVIKKEGNDLYLKFYSAYGFNASLGTNDTYTLDVKDIDEIYFYIGKQGYKKVLEYRNEEWIEPYDEITVNKKI